MSPALASRLFTPEPLGKPHSTLYCKAVILQLKINKLRKQVVSPNLA